jgi:hypothetical protein
MISISPANASFKSHGLDSAVKPAWYRSSGLAMHDGSSPTITAFSPCATMHTLARWITCDSSVFGRETRMAYTPATRSSNVPSYRA